MRSWTRSSRARRRPAPAIASSRSRAPAARCWIGRRPTRTASAAAIESLKRWCAARLHDPGVPRLGRLPVSRDARLLEPRATCSGPMRPICPRRCSGRTQRLRRRDGFKLTDPRMRPREVLSEIHYCVLCHERDKDSCSKGLREAAKAGETAKVAVNPLGIELDGCPLDEKISEMHALRKAGDADRRAGARDARQPDVPGHRPPHLQRLHEGVHLPEAGAGQHPADRDRRADRRAAHAVGRRDLRAAHALESAERAAAVRAAVQRQERPRRRPRPGRLHARALPGERRLRRRRHRRPEDRAAARGAWSAPTSAPPRADSRLERDLPAARRARARRLRRRLRVRHHRPLGQELPDAAAPDAGAAARPADVRRRPVRRHAADRGRVGATASITSRSRPAPAGRRSST